MDRLRNVRSLYDAGRFIEAMRLLETCSPGTVDTVSAALSKAELLERLGVLGQSKTLSEGLLRSNKVSASDRARCELVLGLVAQQRNTHEATIHFQKAIALAKRSGDSDTLCWALLRALLTIVDVCGVDAANTAIRELRAESVKLGQPIVSSALHIFVGQLEAKRGLLTTAEKHARIGQSLLQSSPNVWLETIAENILLCVALLQSDFANAFAHADRALTLAEQCGGVGVRAMTITNLGNLLNQVGRFDEAVAKHRKALEIVPVGSEYASAALESIARTKMTTGDFEGCTVLLREIAESFEPGCDSLNYVHRYTEATRAELFLRTGYVEGAVEKINHVLLLAQGSKDSLLSVNARLLLAEAISGTRVSGASDLINEVGCELDSVPPESVARYEQTLAFVLARLGHTVAAAHHFDRAVRFYRATGNTPAQIEVSRIWEELSTDRTIADCGEHCRDEEIVHDFAHLLRYPNRPELAGRQLLHILISRDLFSYVALVSTSGESNQLLIASSGIRPVAAGLERRLLLGSSGGSTFELVCCVQPTVQQNALFNSMRAIAATLRELAAMHSARESNTTLWPTEEEAIEEDGFVLLGEMRKVMTSARRVARANVTVLVTGESGTGKEVLARAVHRYSDRAARPFVPFNCAAIPRELVESHLFGHRRGAFTGADRDNPGLIRSARSGTIFLDEVGELPLDLQPKLLRFLESGEIAPLGDGSPSTVDVRVVAATNSKLEHAVATGRFREDLFYRLNVIRLEIAPLRERRDEIPLLVDHFVTAAAREFHKGRVRVAEETMEHLLVYRWPGNVRQLQNEIRRMVALAEPDSVMPPTALAPEIVHRGLLAPAAPQAGEIAVPVREKLLPTLSRIEREMIKAALRDHGGRVDAAARALGISRKGLYLKRQRLGL